MYGVLLESSLYADWSNVPRVFTTRDIDAILSKINDEKEQFLMDSGKKKNRFIKAKGENFVFVVKGASYKLIVITGLKSHISGRSSVVR